jgi:hypothetical protein
MVIFVPPMLLWSVISPEDPEPPAVSVVVVVEVPDEAVSLLSSPQAARPPRATTADRAATVVRSFMLGRPLEANAIDSDPRPVGIGGPGAVRESMVLARL